MPVRLSIKHDLKRIQTNLTLFERVAMPEAQVKALTFTAKHVERQMTKDIPRIFKNPTPFMRRALRTKTATFRDLTAAVRFKDFTDPSHSDMFRLHIEGGQRPRSPFENRLGSSRFSGPDGKPILRPGEFVVPGSTRSGKLNIRANKYGNIPRGVWSKMIADIGATSFSEGFQPTKKRGKKKYFYDPNLKPRGIWQRYGKNKARPAVVFVSKQPTYTKRWDFYGRSAMFARRRFPRQLRAELIRLTRRSGSFQRGGRRG